MKLIVSECLQRLKIETYICLIKPYNIMKLKLILFLTLIFSFSVFAGDTTLVRIHDQTDMTWYGNSMMNGVFLLMIVQKNIEKYIFITKWVVRQEDVQTGIIQLKYLSVIEQVKLIQHNKTVHSLQLMEM